MLSKKQVLDAAAVKKKLTEFYDQVDSMYKMEGSDEDKEKRAPHPNVFRYLKAATKATNDKYARVDRAEVIASILAAALASGPAKVAGKKAK